MLTLAVGVVVDPSAQGLDPPKALEVTLRNDARAGDVVWVNGRMAPRSVSGGEVEVVIRSQRGQLVDTCRHNTQSAEPGDYVQLAPGSSITRMLSLSCFHPPSTEPLSVSASYQDLDPAPEKATVAFRGKLVSNTVDFVLRDK